MTVWMWLAITGWSIILVVLGVAFGYSERTKLKDTIRQLTIDVADAERDAERYDMLGKLSRALLENAHKDLNRLRRLAGEHVYDAEDGDSP